MSIEGSPWLAAVAGRTTLGRLGEPEDIAQVILAVHGMEWVTGQVVECDGGLSLRSPIDPYGEALRVRTNRRPLGRRRPQPVADDPEQVHDGRLVRVTPRRDRLR